MNETSPIVIVSSLCGEIVRARSAARIRAVSSRISEGLNQVIVRNGLQCFYPLIPIVIGAQHEDRDAREKAEEFATGFDAGVA